MKILVAIKQVPARDSQLIASTDGKWVDESSLEYEINEPDAYALEEALQLKESAGGGEVIAVCAGPDRASSTIREALAKGADRAIHIEVEDIANWDTLSVAKLLAAAAKAESPDLVLTGLQSDDVGAGQVGVVLAELLGLPHATIIMEVVIDGATVRVKRELEDGWFQHVSMPLPAVLTIQSGIKKLRYATLMGIKRAKTKEVKSLSPADLGVANTPSYQVVSVMLPQKSKQTVMLHTVAELVDKLKNEVRVI
ncbi:electron transfer flavoprotein subunit beta/FixA family protein [Bryobacter aggregatus]|uniref:electron transfer flavoprotein subunit beta/FixA family protein n=1 Tax=Bryobacter aggregatus TaxID=360054 RepID=UPI0004E131CA|nr:electron transfer flavoprotein subunit beta/FixA family protein [Bryobacter aggregatus]